MFTLKQLQTEQKEWADVNFPMRYANPWMPLMGLEEEIGELMAAADKNVDEFLDAIGDITVYLSDYCTLNKIDLSLFSTEMCTINDSLASLMVSLKISAGRLDHFHLKGSQSIRYTPEQVEAGKHKQVSEIVHRLVDICTCLGRKYLDVVEPVWNKVKQRNWNKNPINAAAGLGDTNEGQVS